MNLPFQVQSQKAKVVEMLQSQETIINELIAREPEKVKKLKIQRNQLLSQQETLTNKLQNSDLNNQKIVNEIDKLNSELKHEKDEKEEISFRMTEQIDDLKKMISQKDKYVAKQKKILHLTQHRNNSLMEEELQLKELLKQKDVINSNLKEQIEALKQKIEKKETKNIIQEEECKLWKQRVSILIAEDFKSQEDSREKDKIIDKLKEEINTKEIQICNIQKQVASSRDIVAQTITQMTIKGAQGVVQAEKMLKQIENENHIFKLKAINLQEELNDSWKRINDTEAQFHDAEVKLHDAEAIAATKLSDIQNELKDAVEKRQMLTEMLHTSENAKSQLVDVNKRMKEGISVQNEKVVEMEIKIQSIMKMLKEEMKRNKKLIEEISRIESHMQTIEEEVEKTKRKKRSRRTRLFRYFCTS